MINTAVTACVAAKLRADLPRVTMSIRHAAHLFARTASRFHMAVLDHGAVPLNVLQQLLDEWIVAEQRARRTPAAPR